MPERLPATKRLSCLAALRSIAELRGKNVSVDLFRHEKHKKTQLREKSVRPHCRAGAGKGVREEWQIGKTYLNIETR